MTAFTADFEKGTSGSTISASDAGSATAWTTVTKGGANPTYDNTHPAHGSLAVTQASGSPSTLLWNLTAAEHWGRAYIYLSSLPGSTIALIDITNSGSDCALTKLKVSGQLELWTNTGSSVSSATALSVGTLYRIEWHVIHSTTTGVFETTIYAGDGTSALETITLTGKNTLASPTDIQFKTWSIGWLDQLVANATAYPGPYPVNSVAPEVTGSATQGSTLSCDGGTWGGSFALGYQWTSNGSDIAAATSPSYVTQAGDVGSAIGCKVTATGQQATNESASTASSNTITVTDVGATSGSASGGVNFPTALLINP